MRSAFRPRTIASIIGGPSFKKNASNTSDKKIAFLPVVGTGGKKYTSVLIPPSILAVRLFDGNVELLSNSPVLLRKKYPYYIV
jgi:hypothetical protein